MSLSSRSTRLAGVNIHADDTVFWPPAAWRSLENNRRLLDDDIVEAEVPEKPGALPPAERRQSTRPQIDIARIDSGNSLATTMSP
jgi:hypothetical protein